MRHFHHALITAALMLLPLSQPAIAAGGGKAKAGPEGIPFTCSDGRALRVVYGREGPKAKAKLLWEGADARELEPAHALEGLRYSAEIQPGQLLTWTTDGIEGVLWEETDAGEREVARCKRYGWGAKEAGKTAHSDGHSADHKDGETH